MSEIEAALAQAQKRLETARHEMRLAIGDLAGLDVPMLAIDCQTALTKVHNGVIGCNATSRVLWATISEIYAHQKFGKEFLVEIDGVIYKESNSYQVKKVAIQVLNEILRDGQAAIGHPETAEPCALYAILNLKGNGKYMLESKITKKRSGSYQRINELFPLNLVPDMPRKEGFIEAKKKKDKKKTD